MSIISLVEKIASVGRLDHEFHFLAVNELFQNLIGLHAAEILQRPLAHFLSDNSLIEKIQLFLSHTSHWSGEVELKAANGSSLWLDLHLLKNDSIVEFIGFDITENRSIRQSLLSSMQFREALMDSAPVGILVADKRGHCQSINKYWRRLTGLTLAQALGKGWINSLHPQDAAMVAQQWENFISRDTPFNLEYRYLRNGTDTMTVIASAIKVEGDILRIEYDVTERKRDELLIQQQRMSLEASSRLAALGTFASGVAHEINNPLAIVSGLTDNLISSLDEGLSRPELARNLGKVSKNVDRISRVIKSLVSITDFRNEQTHTKVFLPELLSESISICQNRMDQSGIELKLNPIPELSILCRPADISQIVLNVLSNACDALEESQIKQIEVLAKARDGLIEIDFSDSGPGIPEPDRGQIFDPFFTSKDPGKGTGLGLAISRSIAEAHSGALLLMSEAPQTTFRLILPILDNN
jgi:PAS domain S-box-containing protein